MDIKIQEFIRYLTLKGFKKRLDFPNNDLLVYRKSINKFNLDMVFPSIIIQEIKKPNINKLEVSENVYELDEIVNKEANGVYVVSSKDGANIRIRE